MRKAIKKFGLSLILTMMSGVVAHAQTGDFTIYPSYLHEGNKTWITQNTSAGETITDYVTIENVSDAEETINLLVREADAKGKSFIVKDNKPSADLGLWTTLPQSTYTLKPHEKMKVPVQIAVPKDIKLGKYTATILASKTEKNDQNINIVTRIGVRMYINIVQPGTFNTNVFGIPGTNIFFFVFTLVALLAAIFYNVIHYLDHKKYENQKA